MWTSSGTPYHVQDAICTSLTEYNAHIEELKEEMKGATDSAKNIRSDIQDIRNKYAKLMIIIIRCTLPSFPPFLPPSLLSSPSLPPPSLPLLHRSVTIGADTRCQICDTRLLTQGFYMFPCTHAFHRDCLLQEVHVTCACRPCGMCMSSVWHVHVVRVACACRKCGMCMSSVWHVHVVRVACACRPCGMCMS